MLANLTLMTKPLEDEESQVRQLFIDGERFDFSVSAITPLLFNVEPAQRVRVHFQAFDPARIEPRALAGIEIDAVRWESDRS